MDADLGQDTATAAGACPRQLLEIARLQAERQPFDPMDRALQRLQARSASPAAPQDGRLAAYSRVRLDPGLPAMANVWRVPGETSYTVAAKGAPEAIAELFRLGEPARRELADRVALLTTGGLRVLGVARASWAGGAGPARCPTGIRLRAGGIARVRRPDSPDRSGRDQGVLRGRHRVIMITGDNPGTARSIAREVGLRSPDAVMTGGELDALGDAELRERITAIAVFARVVPEQKLRLVEALKAAGEIVAMTGDGVNDAPALQAAQSGSPWAGAAPTWRARRRRWCCWTTISRRSWRDRADGNLRQHPQVDGLCDRRPHTDRGHRLLPLLFGWPLISIPCTSSCWSSSSTRHARLRSKPSPPRRTRMRVRLGAQLRASSTQR